MANGRISIIQINAQWTPNEEAIGKLFPDMQDTLTVSAGRVRISAQLAFNIAAPEAFAAVQQTALTFGDTLASIGELHKFDQRITTVAELDRVPAPAAVTAGDDTTTGDD